MSKKETKAKPAVVNTAEVLPVELDMPKGFTMVDWFVLYSDVLSFLLAHSLI
jgi:hypothetical protein